jgi:hypothetical protein
LNLQRSMADAAVPATTTTAPARLPPDEVTFLRLLVACERRLQLSEGASQGPSAGAGAAVAGVGAAVAGVGAAEATATDGKGSGAGVGAGASASPSAVGPALTKATLPKFVEVRACMCGCDFVCCGIAPELVAGPRHPLCLLSSPTTPPPTPAHPSARVTANVTLVMQGCRLGYARACPRVHSCLLAHPLPDPA